MKPLIDAGKKTRICAVEVYDKPASEAINSCAIPLLSKATLATCDVLKCTNKLLLAELEQHKDLLSTTPGHTKLAEHFIPTIGTPVKIPPRRILANCRVEVEEQIQTMLKECTIEESSSPWMAPAVFVHKKMGCSNLRRLSSKQTVKGAYPPLPHPDDVQDRLAGCIIFSTLDLLSGYWELPVHKEDQAKTAFCPGPGFGLFQFHRIPFGLSRAAALFQTLMDRICSDLLFTTTYVP